MKVKNKTKRFAAIVVSIVLVVVGVFVYKYGFNRLSQSDCTEYEQYDSLRGECYFECDTEAQCEEIAKKVEAKLDAYFADSQSKIGTKEPASPKPTATEEVRPAETSTKQQSGEESKSTKTYTAEETESDTGGKIYTITSDQSLYPTPSDEDKALWELFLRIASKNIVAERLETFEVFRDTNNDSAASVWESTTVGKWHLNVNAAFASDKKDMIHTMVHEFAHILTLNTTQVDKTSGACPIIQVPEGCIKSGTILEEFYNKFWQQYGESAGGTDDQQVAAYSEEEFVTEYAATNMIEDLAESFAFFVLRPAPNGTTIKDQKIELLYSRPEMVSLRNRIRASLASEL